MQNAEWTQHVRAILCIPVLHSALFILNLNAGSSNSRTSPFEGDYGGANPSPAAIFNAGCGMRNAQSQKAVFAIRVALGALLLLCSMRPFAPSFRFPHLKRSVVKQNHVWPTPRNRRGRTFPSDHFEELYQPSTFHVQLFRAASWRNQQRVGL
jgi:hypothetical protein